MCVHKEGGGGGCNATKTETEDHTTMFHHFISYQPFFFVKLVIFGKNRIEQCHENTLKG